MNLITNNQQYNDKILEYFDVIILSDYFQFQDRRRSFLVEQEIRFFEYLQQKQLMDQYL